MLNFFKKAVTARIIANKYASYCYIIISFKHKIPLSMLERIVRSMHLESSRVEMVYKKGYAEKLKYRCSRKKDIKNVEKIARVILAQITERLKEEEKNYPEWNKRVSLTRHAG